MSTKSRQISLRLSDEEVALLPDGANSSDAVRMLMAKGARIHELETIVDHRIDKLRETLFATLNETVMSTVRDLHERERIALQMILFNLRAIYEGTLRTEALTTAALQGIVDPDITGETLEELLKTRFDAHMSRLWPLFLAENDRGLRSLEGEKRAAPSVDDPAENSQQSRVDNRGQADAKAAEDGERAAANPA